MPGSCIYASLICWLPCVVHCMHSLVLQPPAL